MTDDHTELRDIFDEQERELLRNRATYEARLAAILAEMQAAHAKMSRETTGVFADVADEPDSPKSPPR